MDLPNRRCSETQRGRLAPGLHRLYLGEAPPKPLLVGETGVEERLRKLLGEERPDHSRPKAEHIYIIVFDHLMGGVGVVCDGRPDALDLVGGNAGAGARSADDYGPARSTFDDRARGCGRHVGIVHGRGVVSTEVDDGQAAVGQYPSQMLLEIEPGMICCKSDLHIRDASGLVSHVTPYTCPNARNRG